MIPHWINVACDGNPGALTFIMEVVTLVGFDKAEEYFKKLLDNNIVGSELYMLWNDCCDRNTLIAMNIMHTHSLDDIVEHINAKNGRGISYLKENE